MTLPGVLSSLRAHDVTVLVFGLLLSALNIVFRNVIPQWFVLVIVNGVISVAIALLAFYDQKTHNRILSFIHLWYLVPLIFLTYKELYLVIYPMHGRDYDDVLIAVDRWLFGIDPTVWLKQFTHPLLTEVLQIAYTAYYFLFIVVGYELYRRNDRSQFLYYAFVVVFGFYLSYVGYLFLPAVGPRFTLHNFDSINDELPGMLLTPLLRDAVNVGESIPLGISNPVAYSQRDVFPSGHSMMMLVLMHFAVTYRMKVRRFIMVNGVLMIIATVYLRYHYVVDLIAGAAWYVLCIRTAPKLYVWWERMRMPVGA